MNCTIAPSELEMLLKTAGISRPKASDTLILSACAGRVFVEFRGDVAGIEALVLADGAVKLPAKKFSLLLKTYSGTKFLTLEGGPTGLKIHTLTMPILAWDPSPRTPAKFQEFPVMRPGSLGSPRDPQR